MSAAKSLQSCPTLWDPIDSSPPGSPIPGILQARTLEWVAISFSNAWQWKVKVKLLSRVWLLGTPWIAAYPAPPSMAFSKCVSFSSHPHQYFLIWVLFYNSHSDKCEVFSLWFWFAFPWCLVMWNSFSCAYWSSAFCSKKCLFSSALFSLGCFWFCFVFLL